MVDSVNITSGTGGTVSAVAAPAAVRPSTAAATTASTNTSATKTLNAGSTTQPAVVSSRVFHDPLAGVVVTEQLDSQGQIISQNPSSSVVAYLQNGLSLPGYPKVSVTA